MKFFSFFSSLCQFEIFNSFLFKVKRMKWIFFFLGTERIGILFLPSNPESIFLYLLF